MGKTMETLEFFKWLLPTSGKVVLGLLQPEGWFKNRDYDTIEEAAAAAKQFDATDAQVYMAVHTFKDWYSNDKGKPQIRTQGNVAACRALYDDFDADPNKATAYDTKEEALAGVVQLAKALRLTPSVVDSGGGYHMYIHFDENISEGEWNELADLKRQVTTHLGVKSDRSVDKDSARVLRPVGCTNKKKDYATPLPVTLLKQGKTYSVDVVRNSLLAFINDNDVKLPKPSGFGVVDDFTPLDRSATSEAAMNGVDWHDNMLKLIASWVAKGNTDAEIHSIASQHTLDGYSADETRHEVQVMIDGARGKGFAPPEIAPPVEEPSDDDDDAASNTTTNAKTLVVAGETIHHWPKGFKWNSVALSREIPDPDGGLSTWRPFCRTFIYPLNRIRDSEGTWIVHWKALEKNGSWREFFMPMNELASTDLMAKTLASHEVFLPPIRNARADMAEFAVTIIEELQKWRIETKTYKQFGWLPDRTGFVMGTKMITEKGMTDVLCEDSVPPDIQVDFGRSGTLDEWVSNIAKLYNRPKAEPYQFVLCHSMGSVLVELMGSSNWHGLPLTLTGAGSTGKTTACKIACGFYGNPKLMIRQTGIDGSTLNGMIKRVAVMGAVPVLLDEFSGRKPEELTRTGYALANGRDKERLGTNGNFTTVGGQWFKNSFITSNDSVVETISKLPVGYRVEATQLRFFEVQMPKGYVTKVFPDITQHFTEHHMDNVYGEACLPFIRFIIANTDWVRRQITAARAKFNPLTEEDNKERFYRDTIVTAWVAGKIAQKIGLISFDVKSMKKWAEDQVLTMRENRKENNADISEHLAAFISTLQGRLIVTKRLGHGNTRKEDPAVMLRGPAIGRVCTEDERAFISRSAMGGWCQENGVAPKAMRTELDRAGYLVFQADGAHSLRLHLGQGSTVPSGQTRCYELKYNKLMASGNISVVEEKADE